MEILNWFNGVVVIVLFMILGMLWIIKEVLESKKETDASLIQNSRRYRQFLMQDYLFRKSQRRVNQEMIKKLKATYSEYESMKELREELLGLKINIKEENDDFVFILTAIFSLLLVLVPAVGEMPSVILLIPSILIMIAIASYLIDLSDKIKKKQTRPTIIIYMLPVILTIASIMILGILFVTQSSPADLLQIEGLFKLIVIEGVILYLIQLYESLKYISYLEVVTIVLHELVMEEDRKDWMLKRR